MLTFLEVKGIKLDYTDEDLIQIGLSAADGSMTYEALLGWIIHTNIWRFDLCTLPLRSYALSLQL